MPVSLEQFGLDRLTPEERVELAELLWDSVEDSDAVPSPIPEWHRKILAERTAKADADPDRGQPWDVVRARLLGDNP